MAKQPKPKKSKSRPGAKSRGPFENKRSAVTTRITESTRTALERAAAATGRSVSQETEYRLERSFLFESSLGVLGTEPKTTQFIKDILDCITMIEQSTGGSVWSSRDTTISLEGAVAALLSMHSNGIPPSGRFDDEDNNPYEELSTSGKAIAYLLLRTKIEENFSTATNDEDPWGIFYWGNLNDLLASVPNDRDAIKAVMRNVEAERRAHSEMAAEHMKQLTQEEEHLEQLGSQDQLEIGD
jgi:hypothetical protein